MMLGLLIITSILVIFFGFALYNYHQTDKNKTIPAIVAWYTACFWPIAIPLLLIFWIADKGEKVFDDISKNGLKNEDKQGKSN
jgi:hypothetical protein